MNESWDISAIAHMLGAKKIVHHYHQEAGRRQLLNIRPPLRPWRSKGSDHKKIVRKDNKIIIIFDKAEHF